MTVACWRSPFLFQGGRFNALRLSPLEGSPIHRQGRPWMPILAFWIRSSLFRPLENPLLFIRRLTGLVA